MKNFNVVEIHIVVLLGAVSFHYKISNRDVPFVTTISIYYSKFNHPREVIAVVLKNAQASCL
jgi:hypothetical protein